MTFVLGAFRDDAGGYVRTLVLVYSILIIAYILSSLFFAVGGRLPYNRAVNAVVNFLRDVSEPYLRIFRRFMPMIGPLDLSPIVALFLLNIVGNILASVIEG